MRRTLLTENIFVSWYALKKWGTLKRTKYGVFNKRHADWNYVDYLICGDFVTYFQRRGHVRNRSFVRAFATWGSAKPIIWFLAQRLGISKILTWDRTSLYLTHVILPRLPREDYSFVVLEITRMVVKWRRCFSQKWLHRVILHLSVLKPILKHNVNNEQEKVSIFVWGWDGKIRPSWSPFVIQVAISFRSIWYQMMWQKLKIEL